MKPVKLFLDMDGVLCDFSKGCADIGYPLPSSWLDPSEFADYRNSLYRKIEEENSLFWYDLAPLPDARKLFHVATGLIPDYQILTACPSHMSTHTDEGRNVGNQKLAWFTKNSLPVKASQFYFCKGHEKSNFCEPGFLNILIDDLPSNIERWREAGGVGILHKDAESSLAALMHILRNR